jgi:hypothetical protein
MLNHAMYDACVMTRDRYPYTGNIRANFLEFFCHEPLTKSRTPFILSGFQRLGP